MNINRYLHGPTVRYQASNLILSSSIPIHTLNDVQLKISNLKWEKIAYWEQFFISLFVNPGNPSRDVRKMTLTKILHQSNHLLDSLWSFRISLILDRSSAICYVFRDLGIFSAWQGKFISRVSFLFLKLTRHILYFHMRVWYEDMSYGIIEIYPHDRSLRYFSGMSQVFSLPQHAMIALTSTFHP